MQFVEFLIKYWDKIGEIGHILFILLGSLMIGGITNTYINDIYKLLRSISNLFKKIFNYIPSSSKRRTGPRTQKESIKDVENHKMVMEMNEIKMKFNSLNFGDKKRNRIFQIIMYTKINTTINHVTKFVKINNVDQLDKNVFNTLVSKMLQDMSEETYVKLKIELGEEIYNIVVDSARGMKVWEKENIDSLLKFTREVSNVDYIILNSDVFDLIQSSLSISLLVTYNTMESRFLDFNGELTEVINKTHWNK